MSSSIRKLRPLLVVMSAPSGAGKSTLCRRLLDENKHFEYSISCTTRAPRGEERDGDDYHFLTAEEFSRRVQAGHFLEHAVVHGNQYGTLRSSVVDTLRRERSIVMDIDVEGARQIREQARKTPIGDPIKKAFVDIFIEPPSMEVLRLRLLKRGEDTPEVVARRMKNAEQEMRQKGLYRHCIINDDLEQSYRELKAIVEDEQRM